jgi:hypothetical protein
MGGHFTFQNAHCFFLFFLSFFLSYVIPGYQKIYPSYITGKKEKKKEILIGP